MPPELIRKGRLDEIFFVDLPDSAARIKIFDIRLSNHGQRAQALDLEELARHSEGFSGAEIEQAIVAALYLAREHEGPLDTGHLLTASRQTRPLSVVMTERLSALRSWAKNRRGFGQLRVFRRQPGCASVSTTPRNATPNPLK